MEPGHLLIQIPYGVVVIKKKDYSIEFCNYHKILNISEKVEGRNFYDVFKDLNIPIFTAVIQSLQSNKTSDQIRKCKRINNNQENVSAFVDVFFVLMESNDENQSIMITFSDVTKHVDESRRTSKQIDKSLSSPNLNISKILQRETATLQAFQQREEIFRLLIENSKDGIAILSRKGEVIYVSPSVHSIMGYTESEAIELNVLSLIYAEDHKKTKKIFQVFFTKKSVSQEVRVKHKNGSYIWIEFSITNFLSTPGISAIVINFRDITQRKLAEDIIIAKEKQLSDLADAMPQLVWIADANGTVTYYNQRISEYAGARKTKQNTWDWTPLLHNDDVASTSKEWSNAIKEKRVYYKEHRVKMKDGTFRFHLSRAYPQFDQNGNVTKWFGTATDIHEQKQSHVFLEKYANELERQVSERTGELKRQKDFAETMLDSSVDVIAVYDLETRLLTANQKYFDKFNLKKEEVLGKKLLDIFPKAHEGNERLLKSSAGETLIFPASYSEIAKSYYESYLIPLKDNLQKTYATLVIVHDVTDNIRNEELLRISADQLKEANDLLIKKNHELEQFAYIASHDLQEPLRKIATFANLLEKNRMHPENFSKYTKKIIESSGRMSKLISDVLQYSQLDKKGDITTIDLNEIFKNIQTDLDLLIEQKSATITVDRLPSIEGVNRQLTQLFYNLVSNALKFTKPGQPAFIKVASKFMEQPELLNLKPGFVYYEIIISDDGIGFSQEYAERIFQMFHRLNSKEAYSGSGIGLAMVKKIVETHCGTIWAESEEEKGATFHVVLPTKQPLVAQFPDNKQSANAQEH
jgi:PAS domain S-box-containing protein